MLPKIIVISGGIGSGKSVVCRVLSSMGHVVYDCDTRARLIMDEDDVIKRQIADKVSSDAINVDGSINRVVLSEIVFNDHEKLEALNSIVHSAVRDDIERWCSLHSDRPYVFVETAIMYQSGLDRMAELVWEVTAPLDVKIQRVCRRNNLTPHQVMSRIQSQDITIETPHPRISLINNDDTHSILVQLNILLRRLSGAHV